MDYQLLFSFLASLIGTGIALYLILRSFKGWMTSNTSIRKALLSFFDVSDYGNLIRDSYIKLNDQKDKIKDCLKNAVGRDQDEMMEVITRLYKELDDVMDEYLRKQQALEAKLFNEQGAKE